MFVRITLRLRDRPEQARSGETGVQAVAAAVGGATESARGAGEAARREAGEGGSSHFAGPALQKWALMGTGSEIICFSRGGQTTQ